VSSKNNFDKEKPVLQNIVNSFHAPYVRTN
jgi:hypothetical protein